MSTTNLGDLQSILIGATSCLNCADPRCVSLCPEHVDVRAAMRLIVDRSSARQATWRQQENEATQSAMDAIIASFEFK